METWKGRASRWSGSIVQGCSEAELDTAGAGSIRPGNLEVVGALDEKVSVQW